MAALQRFAPLLALASRAVGTLTEAEIASVAVALTGEADKDMVDVLKLLQSESPDTQASKILGSDAAKRLFAKVKNKAASAEDSIFCKCPDCGFVWEDVVRSQ